MKNKYLKSDVIVDVSFLFFVVILLIIFHWDWLVTKKVMVSHDSLLCYGFFGYFMDLLLNGNFSLWDYYTNYGQPFFTNVNNTNILDPSMLCMFLFIKGLTAMGIKSISLFNFYEYDLFLRYLIFIFGSFLFLRYMAKNRISAYVAFIAIAFSSCNIAYLGHNLSLLFSYLVPLIVYLIFRILNEKRFFCIIPLAFLLGLALSTYNFIYIFIFLLILFFSQFLTGGFINLSKEELVKNRKILITSAILFILLFMRIIPQIIYLQDISSEAFNPDKSTYAYHNLFNFYNFFIPHYFTNTELFSKEKVFLYIGLIPLVFSIFGIIFSKSRHKMGFLITLIILGLISFNKQFTFGFFSIFLPNFLKAGDPGIFSFIIIFCTSYFIALGIDAILDENPDINLSGRWYNRSVPLIISGVCIWAIICSLFLINAINASGHEIRIPQKAVFNISFFLLSCLICFKIIKDRQRYRFNIWGIVIFFILIDLFTFGINNNPCNKVVEEFKREGQEWNEEKWQYLQPVLEGMLGADLDYSINLAFVPSKRKGFISGLNYRKRTILYLIKYLTRYKDGIQIYEKKDSLMGVAGLPWINLYQKYIVIGKRDMPRMFEKMTSDDVRRVVFLYKDLPSQYDDIDKADFEEIVRKNHNKRWDDYFDRAFQILLKETNEIRMGKDWTYAEPDELIVRIERLSRLMTHKDNFQRYIIGLLRKTGKMIKDRGVAAQSSVDSTLDQSLRGAKRRSNPDEIASLTLAMTDNSPLITDRLHGGDTYIHEEICRLVKEVDLVNNARLHKQRWLEKKSREDFERSINNIEISHFSPDNVIFNIEAKQNALFLYSDGYDPFWRVFIDGREDKIYESAFAFKTVLIPKGRHKVEFIYNPRFCKVSLFLYILGLSAGAVVLSGVGIRQIWLRIFSKL